MTDDEMAVSVHARAWQRADGWQGWPDVVGARCAVACGLVALLRWMLGGAR